MSFPQNPTVFLRAQDPSTSTDITNIKTYQTFLSNGDFAGAANFLAGLANGSEMNMNAARFNEVIDAINAIENFYLGLDGQGNVQGYINNLITAYTIIGAYDANTTYPQGGIAEYNGQWYKSLQANNIGNTPDANIGTYWDYYIHPQPAIQYQFASSQPVGLSNGDLWFRTI